MTTTEVNAVSVRLQNAARAAAEAAWRLATLAGAAGRTTAVYSCSDAAEATAVAAIVRAWPDPPDVSAIGNLLILDWSWQ